MSLTPDEARQELRRLRGSIDNMDSALVHLLAERFKVTQRVGELKATAGLPAADPEREAAQIARLRALAVEADLDADAGELVEDVDQRRPLGLEPEPVAIEAEIERRGGSGEEKQGKQQENEGFQVLGGHRTA